MPILWLRVALCCYAVGLLYALLALTRTSSLLNRVALPAMTLGMVFQFVSLTEAVLLSGQLTLASVHNSESLLALMIMAAFMIVYLVYRTTSPGIVVFPLVFVLTFVAATTQQPFLLISPGMRGVALRPHCHDLYRVRGAISELCRQPALSAAGAQPEVEEAVGILLRLPALEVIDEIGYRSLLLGFPFMTLGLVAGIIVAQATYGRVDLSRSQDFSVAADVGGLHGDGVHPLECGMARTPGGLPRYRRGGRRGRAWSANYFSTIHGFVQS